MKEEMENATERAPHGLTKLSMQKSGYVIGGYGPEMSDKNTVKNKLNGEKGSPLLSTYNAFLMTMRLFRGGDRGIPTYLEVNRRSQSCLLDRSCLCVQYAHQKGSTNNTMVF